MSATIEAPDFDALEAGAEGRERDLTAERQRLSLDALTDRAAAKRLGEVERELAELGQRRERASLARQEATRREKQRQADEEAASRAEGLQAARTLQAARQKAAALVDDTARAFAQSLREFDQITTEQERALRQAGFSSQAAMNARPRPWTIDNALRTALMEAHVPVGLLRIQGPVTGNGFGKLAESDARPIEAA